MQKGPASLGLFFWESLGAESVSNTGLSAPTSKAGSSGLPAGPRLLADPAIFGRGATLWLNRKRQSGRHDAHRGVAEAVQPSIPADESHRFIVLKKLPPAVGRRAISG
jgi:hypothetical protein